MYVRMYSTYTWLAVGFTERAAGHVTVQCAENIFHETVAVRNVREKWWTQGEAGRYSKVRFVLYMVLLHRCLVYLFCVGFRKSGEEGLDRFNWEKCVGCTLILHDGGENVRQHPVLLEVDDLGSLCSWDCVGVVSGYPCNIL